MKKYILILLSVSCFGQFNPMQWYEFGNTNTEVNTFIGGVSGTINTRELLATKLGINVGRIKKFEVIGSDIQCAVINGNYTLPAAQTFRDSELTYYIDTDSLLVSADNQYCFYNTDATEFIMNGLVSMNHHGMGNNPFLTKIEANSLINASHSGFGNNPLLAHVQLNSLVSCNGDDFINNTSLDSLSLSSLNSASYNLLNGCASLKYFSSSIQSFTDGSNFSGCTSIELIDMKKCKQLGSSSSVNDGNFTNIKLGCTIRVNISLLTANSGAPEADILYAKTSRLAIVEFYDDDGNYVSTL